MSHKDWMIAVSPKVKGAWNLHHALSQQPIEFFVLLGSVNGIRGNHGQANYASANTFLDAFVRYRQQLNLPASVIDLGLVVDIGYAAERPKLLEELIRGGSPMIDEKDFLDSFNLAIQSSRLPLEKLPTHTSGFVNRAQFVVGGIQRPFDARAQGLVRIYNHTLANDSAETGQTSSSRGGENNEMQQFMDKVSADPKYLQEEASASERFLAIQIFRAVKCLLISDTGDHDADLIESASMSDLAVDSLMAIELQSWWRRSMGTQVSVLELTQDSSAFNLAKLARTRLLEALCR
jgi:hypothetical protein